MATVRKFKFSATVVAAAALLLSACGGSSDSASSASVDTNVDITTQKLVISNWAGYYPEDLAAKVKFENTPQYFGHIEIEVFGKSIEFITVYELIKESEDGWTWAPKKLINNDLNFTNEIASICASIR